MSHNTSALLARLDSEPAAAEQVIDVRGEAGADEALRELRLINVLRAVELGGLDARWQLGVAIADILVGSKHET